MDGRPGPGAPQVVSTVRAASLRAGEWEPAQTLFEGPPAGGIPFAGSVQATFLAGAPDGRALAVWTASGTGVMWSERAPGGAWSPAAVVPGPPSWVRALAVDAAGNAVIAADDSWLGEGRLVVQERPAGGAWSAPAPLGPSAEARFGDLVVAPSGAAAISWKDRTGGILLAERPAGGSWGAPTEVGRGFESDLALGPGGELVLSSTGLELDDPSAPFAMQMRVRSRGPGGAWGPSEILTAPCWNALRPSVVVDAHGDAIAMWIAHDRGTGRMVQFAVRPAGGTWSPSRTLDVSIWEPFSLTAAGDGELLFLRGAMPWGPLPALTLPHDRWTEPAAEGLACAPMPDADDRTRPIDVIGDPGPNGPQADAVTTETRATPPVARNLRIVRSGRRAVVAFTLPRPSRVRATVHRTGRRIARLPDRRMAPGGRTLRLGSLPPGRYRLVLELTGAEGSARITRTFRLGPVPRRR
jgi:hypothetical protein